ncbi:hydroxymethylglutaryl-CoA lyase [Frigidibacter sp. MR17.24]|uniref:hydroxymethylglutaryl-CoA lyase n=1 Tax=Frigidibacter sp. MR17.24 TaxID=3127345 RepID=UPI003012A0E9
MAEHVTIVEVGPRDGLQAEPAIVATADKIALVDLLSATGLTRIEAASFVNPARVPQMADGAAVMAGIARRPGIRYAALAPNLRGLEAAEAAGADEIAIFASASESFSRANINCSVAESLARFAPVLAAARRPVRAYVSCITDCPFEGRVAPGAVLALARRLHEMGCHEICLADTIGRAEPATLAQVLDLVTAELPPARLAGHFHDTGGRALDNISTALGYGLRIFDSAVGGLGGCPFAPGASGNVATGAVVAHLAALGFETGIAEAPLARAAELALRLTGRRPDGAANQSPDA